MKHSDAISDANDIMSVNNNCAHGLHGVCDELARRTHVTYDEAWAQIVLAIKLQVTKILEEDA